MIFTAELFYRHQPEIGPSRPAEPLGSRLRRSSANCGKGRSPSAGRAVNGEPTKADGHACSVLRGLAAPPEPVRLRQRADRGRGGGDDRSRWDGVTLDHAAWRPDQIGRAAGSAS